MKIFILLPVLLGAALFSATKEIDLCPDMPPTVDCAYDYGRMLLSSEDGYMESIASVFANHGQYDRIEDALRCFPSTGWKDGFELYSTLWDYADSQSLFLRNSLPKKVQEEDIRPALELKKCVAIWPSHSDEQQRLLYLSCLTSKIAALFVFVDSLNHLGAAWKDEADKAFEHLKGLLLQIGCRANDEEGTNSFRSAAKLQQTYPDLWDGGEAVRYASAVVVQTLYKLGGDLRSRENIFEKYSCDFNTLISQVIIVHSSRLAAERSRMDFINKRFPSPERTKAFNFMIKENNTVVSTYGVGQKMDFLNVGESRFSLLQGVEDLSDLGSFLFDWEVSAIKDSIVERAKNAEVAQVKAVCEALKKQVCADYFEDVESQLKCTR